MTSSAASAEPALPQLPVDIYIEVLKVLPAHRTDPTSVRTLVSCLQANTLVRTAALASVVWEAHYHARYTDCVPARETERKERLGGDWRLL